eukprot:12132-Heterococcus_DN1.PRE.2
MAHCTAIVQHAIDLHNAVVCACRFLRGICSHQCAVYGSVCTSKQHTADTASAILLHAAASRELVAQ